MYLHEAMRLGAMSCPQGFGPQSIASKTRCALGAALLALGFQSTDGLGYSFLIDAFPVLDTKVLGPFSRVEATLFEEIWRINDNLKWTRERIADWLQPIEEAYYKEHPEHKPKEVVPEMVLQDELVEARI